MRTAETDFHCKVLIIDDEFITRQGMKHMLEWEKEGFQIVGEASNGQEGLLLVEELEPHVVLADIVMPVIDGIEFSEIMGKRYPSIELIILSSYDKFEYVKETLLNGASDYILKPALNPENLLCTLRKAARRIPGMELKFRQEVPYASQIEKFLLGFQDKLDEAKLGEYFPNSLFRLLALNVRGAAGSREDMMSLQEAARGYYCKKKGYVALPIFLKEGVLCIVINYPLKQEAAIILDAQEIADRLQRVYPRAFLVMSCSFSDMQGMRKHYCQEVSREMPRAFYYPGKHLLMAGEYREDGSLSRFQFEAYTRLLSQQRYTEALDMFSAYVAYLLKMQAEEDKLKNLCRNLLYHFLVELEGKLAVDSDRLRDEYFHMLDQALWAERLQEVMDDIICRLGEILKENAATEDGRVMQLKQYVASHYKEPLELSDLAGQFGLSYHYLSSYFNQMAKEGFREYLNKLRIEHAMDLLKNSDMPIAEIGCAAGYSEHSYFCRVFKKITKDTPSSFRRREKLRGR